MKKTNHGKSIMSKYAEHIKSSKSDADSKTLMTTYEQRYKGESSMSATFTQPPKHQTLEEKIAARTKKKEPEEPSIKKIPVEIAGSRYLLGCTGDMSEARIRRIAELANEVLSDTKKNNPGLTNSKVTTLALIDLCDRLITSTDEAGNLKTDLMYYRQKYMEEEEQKKKEPTPMEILASGKDEEKIMTGAADK